MMKVLESLITVQGRTVCFAVRFPVGDKVKLLYSENGTFSSSNNACTVSP